MAEIGLAADTSALVAAHVAGHVHHDLASPPVADCTHVLGPVLTETWSVLRRHLRLAADDVAMVLGSYLEVRELAVPDATIYRGVIAGGRALRLAGNVHDFVIARTARTLGLRLVTLDRGMRRFTEAEIDLLL